MNGGFAGLRPIHTYPARIVARQGGENVICVREGCVPNLLVVSLSLSLLLFLLLSFLPSFFFSFPFFKSLFNYPEAKGFLLSFISSRFLKPWLIVGTAIPYLFFFFFFLVLREKIRLLLIVRPKFYIKFRPLTLPPPEIDLNF